MTSSNIENVLRLLRCPVTRSRLVLDHDSVVSENDSTIRYPIVDGVVDFVGVGSDYDEHWVKFSDLSASSTKLKQAYDFIDWIRDHGGIGDKKDSIIVDIGCGDGNHIPFYPKDSIVIAIDYSESVRVVKSRYGDMKNLVVLRADATRLPIDDSTVDLVVSYGCFNCLPEPRHGLSETSRILKNNGYAAVWGYGTDSFLIFNGIRAARMLAKIFRSLKMEKTFIYSLIPLLYFLPSATRIRPGKNSIAECKEIISTNLAPQYVHILYKWAWNDIKGDSLSYVCDYKQSCGQLFLQQLL